MKNESTREFKDRELFDRISGGYWLKDLLPAHRSARQCRLEQTIMSIPVSSNITILEVGCGAGFSAEYLRGRYHEYCGIDYSDELIKYAETHNSGEGIEFHAINIKDFKTERRFDVVLLVGALHHFDNVSFLMDHVVSLLKPGGWIVANEPHSGNPIIHLLRAIRKRINLKYSPNQLEFTISQLHRIFEGAGLEEIQVVPQGILSTPFAEVIVPFQKITTIMSKYACSVDRMIEGKFRPFLNHITWNVSITGKRPSE